MQIVASPRLLSAVVIWDLLFQHEAGGKDQTGICPMDRMAKPAFFEKRKEEKTLWTIYITGM